MRETYLSLIREPAKIERILLAGAEKARSRATPFMTELRHAVGLRKLDSATQPTPKKESRTFLPVFKQYRESDGQFRFKLVDANGQVLLQSLGFESPKLAGQTIAQLQRDGASALKDLSGQIDMQTVDVVAVGAALAQMAAGS